MDNDKEAMTKNLSSLEFNALVDEDKQHLLYLRKRSHAFTLNMVAHTSYYVAILNEIRRRIDQCSSTNVKKPFDDYNRLKIGLIGCGRLGTHIINGLLEYSNVKPTNVIISTKQLDVLLDDFIEQGVVCCYDNVRVAKSSDLILLCSSTTQTEEIFDEIKGYVKGFIYSIVAGYPVSKIWKLLQCNDIFKPAYSYSTSEDTEETEWSFTYKVNDIPALLEFRENSCPLYTEQSNPIVKVDEKYFEVLFYHSMNICLDEHISKEESLKLVTNVLFRKCDHETDFFSNLFDQSAFKNGRFNMQNIQDEEKKISKVFKDADVMFTSARNQYKAVFDRFSDWRSRK